jgi:hypothetical protein
MLTLRAIPGLPEPDLRPPVVADRGDPFVGLRVAHLLARIPRGTPVRIADLVDRLNAEHLDWLFSSPVVADAIVQLRANWIADYRTVEGIVLGSDERGATVMIEYATRVDPWMIRQVEGLRDACRERLRAFATDEEASIR